MKNLYTFIGFMEIEKKDKSVKLTNICKLKINRKESEKGTVMCF